MPTTEPVAITAESVSRFARALGLRDAAVSIDGSQASPKLHTDGSQELPVPPTYLISLTLPAADPLIDDPEFGLDFTKVLHRDQRFAYHRELRSGDRVACTVTVESIKTVAGNDLLTLRTDVTDAEGLAAEVWTTLFVAGGAA